jgi:VWFA-related protein
MRANFAIPMALAHSFTMCQTAFSVIAYVVQVTDGPHDNCDVFHIFSEGKLRKLAEETGGRLIEAHGMNKIADAFDQISEELHHQYSLGYYPETTNWDGRFRKIQIVAADHHDRKGYYAIPPQQR